MEKLMSIGNVVIETYCLLITIILLICNLLSTRKKTENIKARIMGEMLTVNAGIILAFIITVCVDGEQQYALLNSVMTGLCYAFGAILTELFGEYVFRIIEDISTVSYGMMYFFRVICSVAVILDIVSIFNGMYFGTQNGFHVRGPYFMFNQALILILMSFELIFILVHIKAIGKDAIALVMYAFFPFLSIVIQIFVHEYVLMYPAITLSLFIIYVVSYINQAEMLNQKNEELMKAVQESERSQKEAQKANHAKSEFLSSMSHDIRTPLNAIIGMTGMAVDNIDNKKEALENLSIVQASSKHLLSLVNDVLDLSMIESGKIQIAQNEFMLPELLNEVEKIAWPLSRAKQQQFTVIADHVEHECFIGDMPRLKQILVNFISNSVKYTQSGGSIKLTIEEHATEQPDMVQLILACADNGIGIEKERQREIFEPFVREVKSTVNPIEGTGLGLTIVKNILKAMQGSIDLVSEKDRGSTFTATIPLKLGNEKEMLAQYEEVCRNFVLFIADSKEAGAFVKQKYPEIIGCPCDVLCSDEILSDTGTYAEKYDAILITSEEKPVEVIRKVRQRYPETDIVFGSSMKMLDEEDKILDAGADAVLYRPIFRTTLFEEYKRIQLKKKTVSGKNRYLTGRNILVAEDQPINYAVIEYILQNAGASVSKAENGKEAIEKYLASAPGYFDVILMDIMMPVMNGYDAARAIRKAEREDAGTIGIFAMTANAFSEDIQKALDAGMDGHISKPIEPGVVSETLMHFFSNQKEA